MEGQSDMLDLLGSALRRTLVSEWMEGGRKERRGEDEGGRGGGREEGGSLEINSGGGRPNNGWA